jgi:hypothetical protein
MPILNRVISGGQTGADQAGLATARRLGIRTGGMMPKGVLTEEGPRPDLARAYDLEEAAAPGDRARAERNVFAACGTVIFGDAHAPGAPLTVWPCRRHRRPCLVIAPCLSVEDAAAWLRQWLDEHAIGTLNVAGNRASQAPEIPDSRNPIGAGPKSSSRRSCTAHPCPCARLGANDACAALSDTFPKSG